MELKEAVNYARGLAEFLGAPDINIVFYGDIPNPRGFQCRNTIALSIPLVTMNDAGTVGAVIAHELAHLWEPEGETHGDTWRGYAWRFDALGERHYSDEFRRFTDAYEADSDRKAAAQIFMNHMAATFAEWADTGINRRVDFETFAKGPEVRKVISPLAMSPKPAPKATPCTGYCTRVGYQLNEITGVIKAIVRAPEASGWHTQCSECKRDFWGPESFENRVNTLNRWAHSQGIRA
jgi:hypothetical protein